MRQVVKCKNCGIVWERVTTQGDEELADDLMYECPNCNSNYYELWEEGHTYTAVAE